MRPKDVLACMAFLSYESCVRYEFNGSLCLHQEAGGKRAVPAGAAHLLTGIQPCVSFAECFSAQALSIAGSVYRLKKDG